MFHNNIGHNQNPHSNHQHPHQQQQHQQHQQLHPHHHHQQSVHSSTLQQPLSPSTLPNTTASSNSGAHNLLFEDFPDDFDVSLSGLCLGPADNVEVGGLGINSLPLMNSVFGSISEELNSPSVKVEDEYSLGAVTTQMHQHANNNNNNHGAGDQHLMAHSPPDIVKEKKQNMRTSPIGQSRQQQQHGSAMSAMGHQMNRGTPYDTATEGYYGTLPNDEDSCQSDSYSSVSDTTAPSLRNNKSGMVSIFENLAIINDEKNASNSKRLCFKGLVEPTKESPTGGAGTTMTTALAAAAAAAAAATVHHQMGPPLVGNAAGQTILGNPLGIADIAAASGSGAVGGTGDHLFTNPLNMSNSYDGYAWRRWSKTDAPPVKPQKIGSIQPPHTMARLEDADNREFQYILGAPTAAGTKKGLMTMTYLNQGQSYEIRLKKLKKSPNEPNLKTCVRLGFVEKRLQYRENEELVSWSQSHQKDRLVDIDFTMSYGVFDVNLNSTYTHNITFVWNPGREASIFVKINCISTEFTSKRHGGERGAPLRLIVETMSLTDGTCLDSANCLIKVFKSKGAERKHKTDRDRMIKLPDADEHYLPSYDCTLLTAYKEEPLVPPTSSGGVNLDTIAASPSATPPMSCSTPGPGSHSVGSADSPTPGQQAREASLLGSQQSTQESGYMQPSATQTLMTGQQSAMTDSPLSAGGGRGGGGQGHSISSPISTSESALSTMPTAPSTPGSCSQLPQSTSHIEEKHSFFLNSGHMMSNVIPAGGGGGDGGGLLGISSMSGKGLTIAGHSGSGSGSSSSSSHLSANAGAIETYEWLKRNRFFRLAEQLCDFTGDDLRRLSRDDFIQLCDLKDGIRLFNLLHTPEGPATKLTIFISFDGNEHYALYFKTFSIEEFREKLLEAFQDPSIRLRHLHIIGPNGIRVKITNNVIANIRNESIYHCELLPVEESNSQFDVALRLSAQ